MSPVTPRPLFSSAAEGPALSSIASGALAVGLTADRREILKREASEREAKRQKNLAAQSSELFEPFERIRMWEQLHALRLPLSSAHRLLRVIATQTGLSVAQLQLEQRRRADLTAPV